LIVCDNVLRGADKSWDCFRLQITTLSARQNITFRFCTNLFYFKTLITDYLRSRRRKKTERRSPRKKKAASFKNASVLVDTQLLHFHLSFIQVTSFEVLSLLLWRTSLLFSIFVILSFCCFYDTIV